LQLNRSEGLLNYEKGVSNFWGKLQITQKPPAILGWGFCCLFLKVWHRPTLPPFTAVPSALAGLTSLFGMGRGGHRRYRHLDVFNVGPKGGEGQRPCRLSGFNNDIWLKEEISRGNNGINVRLSALIACCEKASGY